MKDSLKLSLILGLLVEAQIDLNLLIEEVQTMSDKIDTVSSVIADLKATMENQTTVIGSFGAFLTAHDAALLATINAQSAAGATPDVLAPLEALRDGFKANTDSLTASLVVRTPADPANPAPATDSSVPPATSASTTSDPAPAADPAAVPTSG